MVEASDKLLRPWRQAVTAAARAAWQEHRSTTCSGDDPFCGHWAPRPPLDGPVTTSMQFVLPRPRSHLTSKGNLRKGAPLVPTGKPDRNKLERAVEDSLTVAGVWQDDARAVATIRSEKRYGAEPGCQLALYVPEELF